MDEYLQDPLDTIFYTESILYYRLKIIRKIVFLIILCMLGYSSNNSDNVNKYEGIYLNNLWPIVSKGVCYWALFFCGMYGIIIFSKHCID